MKDTITYLVELALVLTVLFVMLVVPVRAQEKTPEKPVAEKKEADRHNLSDAEKNTLAAFIARGKAISEEFNAQNAKLDTFLTDAEKIALVNAIQSARGFQKQLQAEVDKFVGELRAKYKCADCQLEGPVLVKPKKEDLKP